MKSKKQMKAIHAKKRAKKHRKSGQMYTSPKESEKLGSGYFKGKSPLGDGKGKGFYQGKESLL